MGGSGSGQWYRFSTKTTVEECSVLSISTFKDALKSGVGYRGSVRWTIGDREAGSVGYRVDRVSGQLAIRLLYTITRRSGGEEQDYDYPVFLQTIQPNFGGVRWWFTCPLVVSGRACGRRVAKLYLPPTGRYFGCRQCFDLVYQSQREDSAGRLLRRAQDIRVRLGGQPGLLHPFPEKPKGMHWQTYRRLRRESEDAADWSLIGAAAKFNKMLAALVALKDDVQ